MGSTFFSLHYHIVFSTKERRPLVLADDELKELLGKAGVAYKEKYLL